MSDDALAQLYTRAVADGDERLADEVMAELDRRDEHDEHWGDERDQAALLGGLAGGKVKGEREQAKEAYQDWLHAQYVQAVEATNGALLSKAGKAAGVNEMSLFNGTVTRPQMKKYASEELLRWFAQPGNGRMTETEFVNQWLGKETVAARNRRQSALGEF